MENNKKILYIGEIASLNFSLDEKELIKKKCYKKTIKYYKKAKKENVILFLIHLEKKLGNFKCYAIYKNEQKHTIKIEINNVTYYLNYADEYLMNRDMLNYYKTEKKYYFEELTDANVKHSMFDKEKNIKKIKKREFSDKHFIEKRDNQRKKNEYLKVYYMTHDSNEEKTINKKTIENRTKWAIEHPYQGGSMK